ncbi:alpha/beta-hydrolase [Setomelanomma holmii]|uniref:Alpha/beta-hydrolase n=1 Tax=Setomelanomma holmii TaxID=210430 RepID=A0A9P4GXQ6_9PLEO|nr:alpha/beta-hydrolase [Setomelanomma holmii]
MIRQIQKRPLGSVTIPLFLFHDASGTISSYYALGLMGRDVYAIADPCMESDNYESLLKKSRRHYAAIKSLVPEGRILLGGWSLGGMIALQVAWYFASDPKVDVDGVIMVDSPFPDYSHMVDLAPDSPISEDGPSPSMDKLKKCILQSVNMLQNWQPPVWRRGRQPYTVMLCASERMISEDHPALSVVDQFRDSSTLGWDERTDSVVIDKSYPIRGHHFNIFEPKNVSND